MTAMLYSAALASGVLLAAQLPPFGVTAVQWVAFVPMLLAARAASGVVAPIMLGVIGTMPMFMGAFYGMAAFRSVFILVPVALTAVAAGLVAVYSVACRRRRSGVAAGMAFAGLWILLESQMTRTGIPWSIALVQSENIPLIQIASVLGIGGVSGAVLLANVGMTEAIWRAVGLEPAWRVATPLLVTGGAIGAALVYGTTRLSATVPEGRVDVAIVQPALASELYAYQWLNPAYRHEVRGVVDALSAAAAAGAPDLLVWPENGNGQYNFRVPALRRAIEDLARSSRASLLLSSYDQDGDGRNYNAVFSVGPDGEILGGYRKQRLVPGGEEGFSRGNDLRPLPTRFGSVGAMVCLESTLPRMAHDLVARGAELLLVTTSDVSMRRSATPILHGRFSVFRAVENGRWLVMASNAGPSLVVDPTGRVRASSRSGDRTVLRAAVGLERRTTPYGRYGDVPMLVVAIVSACAGLGWSGRRRGGRTVTTEPAPVRLTFPWLLGSLLGAGGVSALTVVASIGLLAGAPIAHWGDTVRAFAAPFEVAVVPQDAMASSRARDPNQAALAYALALLGMDAPAEETRAGVRMVAFDELLAQARTAGLRAWCIRDARDRLAETPKPVLADVGGRAVVVLAADDATVDVFDPAAGILRLPPDEFSRRWNGDLLAVRFPPLPGIDGPPPPPRTATAIAVGKEASQCDGS